MSNHIKSVLVVFFCFLSTAAFALKTINLSPNESKVLTNSFFTTLNATCNVKGNTQTNSKIKISILKNNGKINGKQLSTGQATMVRVKDKSSISVRAEPGAQINLINMSSDNLQAVCFL